MTTPFSPRAVLTIAILEIAGGFGALGLALQRHGPARVVLLIVAALGMATGAVTTAFMHQRSARIKHENDATRGFRDLPEARAKHRHLT